MNWLEDALFSALPPWEKAITHGEMTKVSSRSRQPTCAVYLLYGSRRTAAPLFRLLEVCA